MAEFDGLSRLSVEARCAAEVEPLRELGVWAEALAMPVAKAARIRSFFIKIIEVEIQKQLTLPYGVSAPTVRRKIYGSAYAATVSSLPNSLSTRLAC